MGNYRCDLDKGLNADAAVCRVGLDCHLKGGGCAFYDAYRKALRADVVVTNYAYWFSCHTYGDGLGSVDTLVLDEAHSAHEELSSFLGTQIEDWEVDAYLDGDAPPSERAEQVQWSREKELVCESQLLELAKARRGVEVLTRARELMRLKDKLSTVRRLDDTACVYVPGGPSRAYSWTPVDVTLHNGKLFRGVEKIILTSATMSRKTLSMLGLTEFLYREYPAPFPKSRRPVVHVPTVSVKHRWSSMDQRMWVDRIDQILDKNLDRKGIIHTVSYARAKLLYESSRHRGAMIVHERRTTQAMVKRFRKMGAPSFLVSPSLSTGYDFPGEECEFQIIAKIAFPDSSNPVIKKRTELDKDYPLYLAMVQLVQSTGRGMRASSDQCSTYIIDDNIQWFLRKAKQYAPGWWLESYSVQDYIPRPLYKLRGEA
jgi:Rad3-related DNA helicase